MGYERATKTPKTAKGGHGNYEKFFLLFASLVMREYDMWLRKFSSNLIQRGPRKITAKRPGVLENFSDESNNLQNS